MITNRLSVAMIEPVGGHGGMAYYDFGLCAGLVNSGCAVSLYTCDKTEPPQDQRILFHPVFAGIYGRSPSWYRALRYLSASVRTIITVVWRGQNICHFHFFHGGATEMLNLFLAKIFLRKIVITVHDVESFGRNLFPMVLLRWMYGLADGVIVHNRVCKVEVEEKLGVQSNRIHVIPHGNYLHAIDGVPSSAVAKNRLGIGKDKKVILFFGQIKEVKGLDLVIAAIPGVLANHPDAVLLIAGRPWRSDFSRYEAMMDALDVRANCLLHIHYIADEDVPDYFGACDVVVLPYRRIYQSGVVLMAMSYGKPVLVSDLPGMTEIVQDGENGFVFKQNDKDDLAERLNRLLDNEVLRNEMGRKGLKYVRVNHDWQHIGIQIAHLYQTLG